MPGSDTDATCTRLTCSGPGKTTGLEPADSQWPLAWRGRSWRFQAESHQEFSTRKEPLCSLPTSETSLFLSLLPLLAFQWNCQKNKQQTMTDDVLHLQTKRVAWPWWELWPRQWTDSHLTVTQETTLSMSEWSTATFSTVPILYRWNWFGSLYKTSFHEHLTLNNAERTKAAIESLNPTHHKSHRTNQRCSYLKRTISIMVRW